MEENHYCVYMHTSPSGKRYIGMTGQKPSNRWVNGKGYRGNTYFVNAIKKYGWDNIKHEILFSNLSKKEAMRLEQICIVLYRTRNRLYGYNITIGGECGSAGLIFTEERRKEISQRLKGHAVSEETRQKISQKNKGRIVSDEQKRKLKEINTGFHHTKEVKKKISEFHKARYAIMSQEEKQIMSERFTGANNINARKVFCIETNTVYGSGSDAAKAIGCSPQNVTRCCRGETKSCSGYHFCFEEDILNYDYESKLINQKYKKIYCYETDTVYPTSAQAAFELFNNRNDNSGIIRNCQGKQSECKSYHFCYADEIILNAKGA